MFKRKNHVGRPSNDELKKRKIKKILMFSLPVVAIGILSILIATTDLSKLMGNSVTKYYCIDSSYKLEGTNCVKTTVKNSARLADVNLDGKIDNNDLIVLNNYVKDENSEKLSYLQLKVADINSDGMISEADVQILEGYFTKVSGTHGGYAEKIGVKRFCDNGYTLKNDKCELIESIPAKKVENSVGSNDSSNNKTENINNTNNNVEKKEEINNNSELKVTLRPEDNQLSLTTERKYKLYIDVSGKDNSKQYYYNWIKYKYDEANQYSKCMKLKDTSFLKFTVNGTNYVDVGLYSDSKCNNKVATARSETYTCNGCSQVDVSLTPQDNKTELTKGTIYNLKYTFKINDKNNKYYYIWHNSLNGNLEEKTNCKQVTEGEHTGSFVSYGNNQVRISIYSDSKCENRINTAISRTYKCTDCPPLSISVGKNLDSSQPNGTTVHNGIIFNVADNSNTYYYIWRTYNDDSIIHTSDCQAVVSGKEYVKDLTINKNLQVRKGTITVYSDSNCNNRITSVPIAETNTYTCSNCDEENYDESSNSDWSNFWGDTSNYSNTSIGIKTQTNCLQYKCPDGYEWWQTGGTCRKSVTKYQHSAKNVCIAYKCPDGYEDSKMICKSKYKTRSGKYLYARRLCSAYKCPDGYTERGGECIKSYESYQYANRECASSCQYSCSKYGSDWKITLGDNGSLKCERSYYQYTCNKSGYSPRGTGIGTRCVNEGSCYKYTSNDKGKKCKTGQYFNISKGGCYDSKDSCLRASSIAPDKTIKYEDKKIECK